jgi:Ca2+-binding RTX toxin-like protein
MKPRAILLIATMAAALIVTGGVALAERIEPCDDTPPCYGTPERDLIVGNYAMGGDDFAEGAEGDDTIYASSGNDTGIGEEGSDKVYGGSGNDRILASQNDTAGSTDYSYGGSGNDFISAQLNGGVDDNSVDIIDCGEGSRDHVIYDAGIDRVKNCEKKEPQQPL